MRQSVLLAVGAVFFASIAVRAADTYEIDKAHSRIGFAVKHMMVATTRGEFKDYTGEWKVDLKDLSKSSIKVVIQVASIDTAEPKRDEHLCTGDFFDAAAFPTISFTSTKIAKKKDGYEAFGDLTIKDVTKKVVIPFVLNGPIETSWGFTAIGIEGALTINRQDFNVTYNQLLDNGGLVVGNEVKIDLVLEGHKPK